MHHAALVVFGLLLLIVVLSFGPDVAVLFALGAFALFVATALGISMGDYLSVDARTERAARAGRLGEALRRYVQSHSNRPIEQIFMGTLAGWSDARRALCAAAVEVAGLQQAIVTARAAGVARVIVDPVATESQVVATSLWRAADRLGAVEAQRVDSETIRRGVADEVARLDQLAAALRAARTGLAELTLLGGRAADLTGEVESARIRLRALGEAAREIAALEER